MKVLNFELFDEIEGEAKVSPRHRMNHDLRTQTEEPVVHGLGFRVEGYVAKDVECDNERYGHFYLSTFGNIRDRHCFAR